MCLKKLAALTKKGRQKKVNGGDTYSGKYLLMPCRLMYLHVEGLTPKWGVNGLARPTLICSNALLLVPMPLWSHLHSEAE